MKKLEKFLELNNIDKESFLEAVYTDIIELIFRKICLNLKKDENLYFKVKQAYFSTKDELYIIKQLVNNICNCEILEEDLVKINTWLKAFYSKQDKRKSIENYIKRDLLIKQNYSCAICHKKLSNDEIRLDHIIPFDLVGDELENNYQILCTDCNLAKSDHIAQSMFNIIVYNNKKL